MDPLLRQVVLVFLVAGGVLTVFHRLRLPAVVGLVVAGAAIGPHGAGILLEGSGLDRIAEVGIFLLMFSIGLDFAPDRLGELRRAARLGLLQMLICIALGSLAAAALAERPAEALLLGFIVAHTSSSFMLKLLLDRGELSSPQARLGIGISLTQDLSVVPMLLAVPLMAGGEGGGFAAFGAALGKAVGVLLLALLLARWVIPFWLDHVVRSRSRELFLIFLVIVTLGTAWGTTAAGLSGALGAFLAGLAVAASRYVYQTIAEVVPFRDLLVSLFFISMGALVDPRELPAHAGTASVAIALVLVVKFASGFLPTLLSGSPLRVASLVGAGMAQVGEFGFVLAHTGREAGLVADARFQLIVITAIGTLLVNPLLVARGEAIARALAALPLFARREAGAAAAPARDRPALENHVVVAGYGLNGRTIVRALRALEVPCVALDIAPAEVRAAQEAGEPVEWGDSTRADVLRRADLESARLLVVAISDPWATRQTVQVARHASPGVRIIARTKYQAEIDILLRLGANDVISEELETSLEILARTLHAYELPRLRIEEIVHELRGDAYDALRGPLRAAPGRAALGEALPPLEIETLLVPAGSPADGKTLRELDLRARTGATLLAVRRGGSVRATPPPDHRFRAGDAVILAGTPRQVLDAARLIERGEGPETEAPGPAGERSRP